MESAAPSSTQPLMEAWLRYRQARTDLLKTLELPLSNRDPFAEFSEKLVRAILGGQLATNRVQKGWDVEAPGWGKVQVKYVANPAEAWINGHAILHTSDMDQYALVIFDDFHPKAILMFATGCLGLVCQRLKKRHPQPGPDPAADLRERPRPHEQPRRVRDDGRDGLHADRSRHVVGPKRHHVMEPTGRDKATFRPVITAWR